MTTILDRFLETRKSLNTRSAYRVDILAFLARLDTASRTRDKNAPGLTYPDFCRISRGTLSSEVRRYLQTFEVTEPLRAYILNPRTINRKKAALSTFFRFLVTNYGYPANPMAEFQTLSVRSKSTTDVLTEKEVLEVLAFMKGESDRTKTLTAFRDSIIILFLFRYALRRKELVSLQWDDFCPIDQVFHLIQKGNDSLVKPLLPGDWERLCALRKRYEEAKITEMKIKSGSLATGAENPFVFHAVRGVHEKGSGGQESAPLTPGYVYQMVRSVAKKLFPGKNITPHSFRGTFVGMSLNQHIEPGEIANATGHKSVKMVYYYDRRDPIEHNAIVKLAFPLT